MLQYEEDVHAGHPLACTMGVLVNAAQGGFACRIC
jgi:hypothetical protein